MNAPVKRPAISRNTWVGLLLVGPLLLFLLLNFLAPITLMLSRAVHEQELPAAWPHTAALLRDLPNGTLPDTRLASTFASELMASRASAQLSPVANRLNYDQSGFRSLLFRTARRIDRMDLAGHKMTLEDLTRIDPRWGTPQTWVVMKHAAGPTTSFYLLAALDLRRSADGEIARVSQDQAVFGAVLSRTFLISAAVATLCVILGYPLAYLLATLPQRHATLLLILVMLPFWTSVLVRTTAWTVLLQRHGIINETLTALRAISTPVELMYNRLGVLIAMTHVLLPYLVLPLYGLMKRIPAQGTRAALSLGASPWRAFRSVYFPQTLPGVAAGTLMVFILALGYYITPTLIGGAGDEMIAQFIAFYVNQTLNWGMAAALSVILLATTLLLYFLYSRLGGGGRMSWSIS